MASKVSPRREYVSVTYVYGLSRYRTLFGLRLKELSADLRHICVWLAVRIDLLSAVNTFLSMIAAQHEWKNIQGFETWLLAKVRCWVLLGYVGELWETWSDGKQALYTRRETQRQGSQEIHSALCRCTEAPT